MTTRDLSYATPRLREFALKLIEECKKRGITIIITCVARDILEQAALYAQGRKSLNEVNALRKIAGLPPLILKQNLKPVTWTMKSKHIIDRHNETANDDFSHAIDIAVIKDNKAVWDLKVDVNENDIPDYIEVGKIAEEIDPTIIGGWKWKKQDLPHYQDVA